jgi:hypothetical protein
MTVDLEDEESFHNYNTTLTVDLEDEEVVFTITTLL